MRNTSILLIAFAFALASCSTASVRVMPGENGIHRVVVRDIEKHNAEEEAVKAAEKYCDKHGGEAVFISETGTKYTGDMDESTRNTVRSASKAATVLGPMGGVIQTAGIGGQSMTNGKDYQSELKFRCKQADRP